MNLPRRASALLAAGVVLLGFGCQRADRPSEVETRALAQALGGLRVVEARLTGFDHWADWTGGTVLSEAHKAAVLQSADAIQKRKTLADDPGWYASLGVRHLLLGEGHKAIALLESSRAMAGDRASRLNDLAAACFAHASATKNAERLAYALDLAEGAARANPSLLAARFNRALILESLGPASRAAEAWSDYLLADGSSGWAREAARRRDRLTAAVQQMRADSAGAGALSRKTVEERLFTWSQAVITGDQTAAAAALTAAGAAAEELRTRHNHAYSAGLVADVRRHERLGRAKAFALAYVAGREGRDLIQSNAVAAGALRIADAAGLTVPGETFFDYLAYWQLHVTWYQQPAAGLERPLRDLIVRSQRNGSDYIAARSRVLLGSVLQRLARYSEAIQSYQRGIDDYRRIAEPDGAASARMLLAAALREHGMWQEAWRNESMALSGYDALATDSQRHSVLHEATRLALARRQTALAARFQGFLAAHAREWNEPGPLTSAAVAAARVALQSGLPQDANVELARAEQTMNRIADEVFRESYRLEVLTLKTEVQTHLAPVLALETARQLLQAADRDRVLYRRVRANGLFGQAAMAAGQTAEAAAAWQRGIAALEYDNLNAEEHLRIARTTDVWAMYDDLTRLLIDQQQPREALEAAERGRARGLLSALAPSQQLLPIDASLGRSATILFYALLRNRTLIWVIDGEKIILRESPGGVERATTLSNELGAVAASQRDARPVLRRLYQALVSPIAEFLRTGGPLIVVPDGPLSSVPFAALLSPDTGRLLVEDHELQVAPSLALIRRALDGRDSPAAASRVLALGSPAASGGLPALPGARREVEQIRALYGQNPAAPPDQLSVKAFLNSVRGSDVVHFAGHAVEDRDFPDRSFLAMPGSERLMPAQIRDSDFGRVRLVVLSACSTAGGAVERGEGVLSLARPFLAAGVRQVLATVNAVNDDVTPLLVDFHKKMRAGATPAAALRDVQREAYRREGRVSLRGWAAFELFGVAPSR